MNKIQLSINEITTTPLFIGFEGENEHTEVTFYWTILFSQYPDAVATFVIRPPQGEAYPKVITQDGNKVVWEVSASDTTIPGKGEYQLTFTNGTEVIKSYIGTFNVMDSIVGNGEAPTPVEDWIAQANEKLAEVEDTIAEIPGMVEDDVAESVSSWLEENIDPDTGYVIDKTLTVENAAADAKAVGDILFNKADCDEELGETIAHVSRMVLSDQSTPDTTPYLFRKSFDADFLEDALVGGTVAWNQYVKNGNFQTTDNWQATNASGFAVSNGIAQFTPTAKYGNITQNLEDKPIKENHIYLAWVYLKADNTLPNTQIVVGDNSIFTVGTYADLTSTWQLVFLFVKRSTVSAVTNHVLAIRTADNSIWGTIYARDCCFFDLTQMFGSTIADYVYTLEQGTAGAGVAWFRNLFPNDYYAYDAGSLQSVKAKEKRCVGFNQWDEQWEVGTYNVTTGEPVISSTQIRSKNFIRVLPNTSYYVKVHSDNSRGGLWLQFYDENKNIIDRATTDNNYNNSSGKSLNYKNNVMTLNSECHYVKFYCEASYGTTYNHDICINISKPTGTPKNGDYVPYSSHTYPLGSDELRGLYKLDANNKLYCDGDVKKSSGEITRKYGIVDLGTLNYIYDSSVPRFYTTELSSLITKPSASAVCNARSAIYTPISMNGIYSESAGDMVFAVSDSGNVSFKNTAYSTASAFKTAMSGVYLVYELATPTTETADPFVKLQYLNPNGTEEYVDAGTTASTPTRDVGIPVGGDRKYYKDFRREIRELIASLS